LRTIQITYIALLISGISTFCGCDFAGSTAEGDADKKTFQPLPEDYDVAFHADQFFADPLPDTRYERKDGSIIVRLPGFEKTPYFIDKLAGKKPYSQIRSLYPGYEVFRENGRSAVRKDDGTVTVPPVDFTLTQYITANGNILCSSRTEDGGWRYSVINVENRVILPMVFKRIDWISSDVILGRTDTSVTSFTPQGDTIYHLSLLKDFYISGNDIVEGTLNHYDALTGRKSAKMPGQFIAPFLVGAGNGGSPDAEPDYPAGLTREDVHLEGVFSSYRVEYEYYPYPPNPRTSMDSTYRLYMYTYNDTTYVANQNGRVRQERYIDRDKTGERFIALRNTLGGNAMYFPAVNVNVEKFMEIKGDSIIEIRNNVALTPGGRGELSQTRMFGHRIGY